MGRGRRCKRDRGMNGRRYFSRSMSRSPAAGKCIVNGYMKVLRAMHAMLFWRFTRGTVLYEKSECRRHKEGKVGTRPYDM